MSKRAREKAFEAYPNKEINGVWLDYSLHRELFQKAYEQAEKDMIELLEGRIALHLGHALVDADTTAADGLIEAKKIISDDE